jgi:hypothetical protein
LQIYLSENQLDERRGIVSQWQNLKTWYAHPGNMTRSSLTEYFIQVKLFRYARSRGAYEISQFWNQK